MQAITLQSHVGSDGILKLHLPDELQDTEVTVTIQPIYKPDRNLGVDMGWPEGFFAETFGSVPDLEIPPQGEVQQRDVHESLVASMT